MGLCIQRLPSEIPEHHGIGGSPFVEALRKVMEQFGGEKRACNDAIRPFDLHELIEKIFVRIVLIGDPLSILPDMDAALVGDRFEEGRFAAPVLSHEKNDRRTEFEAPGATKNLLIEGVMRSGRIFVSQKRYSLKMHDTMLREWDAKRMADPWRKRPHKLFFSLFRELNIG